MRLLLLPRFALVVATLACATAPLAAQAAAAIETRMVEVDGRSLRVQTGGWHHRDLGRPIVIFQNGMGTPLEGWRPILSRTAEFAAVVAYDRAGIGGSEWDEQTPTPAHVNATLSRLLEALGAEPPYVLVGFSLGGSYVQHFAGTQPDAVAGLVFIDAPELTRWREREAEIFAALGIGHEARAAFYDAERRLVAAAPPAARAELDMVLDMVSRPVPELETLTARDVPTAVLMALRFEMPPGFDSPIDYRRIWDVDRRLLIRQHTDWIASNEEATIVLASHAGHAIHWSDPDLVVESIRRVIFPDVARQLMRSIAADGAPAAVDLYHRLRRSYPAQRFDEELLNQLGYRLLREQDTAGGIALFELNVREYPDAANTHDSLGDGYAAAGRLQEALASYRRAVQLAEASGDARLANFRRNVERIEQRLQERTPPTN
jgi:pimeloyl-ACP methyl ester carboxylesterase